MSKDSAHSSYWQTGEVIFGIPFLAAIALQFIAHLSFPGGFLRQVFIIAGIGLIFLGVSVIVLARREFAQHSQPTDPGRPTTRIVTTGIYGFTRNPIYLGAACFLSGLALAVNLPWVLILLLPSLAACHYVLIAPEERYLTVKFGVEYRNYAATVHRWIGRSQNPGYRDVY